MYNKAINQYYGERRRKLRLNERVAHYRSPEMEEQRRKEALQPKREAEQARHLKIKVRREKMNARSRSKN